MAALENVATDDLRQGLAEVTGKKPAQRLMAAINYLEDDDLTQIPCCTFKIKSLDRTVGPESGLH
ncbi:transposase (ISHnew96) [Halococcus thailandensis JCM 13552]|uniref:Transposase (ISHnew96) n=1 Tax=Halococcus thailandensis JCM 13552 TaxID=1227457 RepID=M0MVL4_9EURY|nr:transposase (ISHnew96) [Halococcus thailandensis JCM 13552]